jgi:hypothetical protein
VTAPTNDAEEEAGMKVYAMIAFSQHEQPARAVCKLIRSESLTVEQVTAYCKANYTYPEHVTVVVQEVVDMLHIEDHDIDDCDGAA